MSECQLIYADPDTRHVTIHLPCTWAMLEMPWDSRNIEEMLPQANLLPQAEMLNKHPKEVRLPGAHFMNRNFRAAVFSPICHSRCSAQHELLDNGSLYFLDADLHWTSFMGVADKISCHSVSAALDGDI